MAQRLEPALHARAHRVLDRALHLPLARRGAHPHRAARELRLVRLGHRPHRRCAHRLHATAAVLGVPHRRGHQQHLVEERAGAGRAPGRGLGRAAVAGRFAPRLRGAGHFARVFRALPLRRQATAEAARGQALQRTLRCGGRCRSGRQARLPRGPEDHARARQRRAQRGRACRQALHRGRRARAHRHAGGPHGAHRPRSDGGHPPRMGGRRADAGREDSRRTGAQVRPHAQERDGRTRGPEEPRRGVRRAALDFDLQRRTADGHPPRRRARRVVERDRHRRERASCSCPRWSRW
jgi:hypothetical protein